MLNRHKINALLWFPVLLGLILAYNNCGQAIHSSGSGEDVLASGASCDEVLLFNYKKSVYPFFRSPTTCMNCHIEGGQGLGLFSSEDIDASFAAFSAAGVSKVAYMATNSQHKPPYTGPQHKTVMDGISQTWMTEQSEYLECVSKTENGGVNESFLTSAKKAPTIYTDQNLKETLTWDLDFAEDLDESTTRIIPARLSVDVSVLYKTVNTTQYAIGYVFSNPTMQIKDPSKQVVIEGLFFQINGQPISSQTTYTYLSRVVTGTASIPLMSKVEASTPFEPVTNQDQFQLYIRRLTLTSGTEETLPPMRPILNVVGTPVNSQMLIGSRTAQVVILRDAGITRWCLSESPTRPASTEEACQNSMAGDGIINGWSLSRPTAFQFSTGDGPKKLYLWVADSNLLINTDPATFDVVLDTTPPAAPTIGAITVGTTQVAPLSVTHPNEADVAGWCVYEQNSVLPAPAQPGLNNACWRWTDNGTKPTTVGFKDGGTRNVWVFVRDAVGNVSNASNVRSAVNNHGEITFAKLTNTSGGAQAVFFNQCYKCHGAPDYPGYNTLNLFEFSAARGVATTGTLVSRINNPTSPMPNINGGLMPKEQRDLIRLWTMPEGGANNIK